MEGMKRYEGCSEEYEEVREENNQKGERRIRNGRKVMRTRSYYVEAGL